MSGPTEEALLVLLRERLRAQLSAERHYYSGGITVRVSLELGGEEIAYAEEALPQPEH